LGFKNGQFSRIITIVGSIWQKFGRDRANIQKLETIAKLHTYYNSNAKKELSYFADEMNENEVLKILNQTNIETFEKILEEEDLDKDEF
ncbi:3483_t:CDS:2, partial [Gigaspora rosea]